MISVVALACHAPPPARDATQETLASYVRGFRGTERVLIESLSRSDPRLARRLRAPPPPRFTDPFQFDVRAIGLENVVLELARLTLPEWHGAEPRALVEHRLEEELIYRLLLEEQFRLARERDDVRAAAGLLQAIAHAWPRAQIETPAGARFVDSVLAWRLAQVRGALQPFAVSEAERVELREAVDALDARVSARLPRVRAELVRLRAAIALAWAAPFAIDAWDDVAAALHAHLGVTGDADALLARLERTAAACGAQAEVGLGVVAPAHAREVRDRAGRALHAAAACRAPATDSVMRALAPPPERAAACALVQSTAASAGDLDELAALVTLHDAAAVGAWALALHGRVRDAGAARARWPLMATSSAANDARLVRLASTRPVEAIAAALAAELLVRDGVAYAIATGRAWAAFGDAPFDIVARELFGASRRRAPLRPNDLGFVPDAPASTP